MLRKLVYAKVHLTWGKRLLGMRERLALIFHEKERRKDKKPIEISRSQSDLRI